MLRSASQVALSRDSTLSTRGTALAAHTKKAHSSSSAHKAVSSKTRNRDLLSFLLTSLTNSYLYAALPTWNGSAEEMRRATGTPRIDLTYTPFAELATQAHGPGLECASLFIQPFDLILSSRVEQRAMYPIGR